MEMPHDRKEFECMKDEYYLLRGWDVNTGLQKKEKLEKPDLSFTCSAMDNPGLLKISL
jgi:aldehyde:ferredoxin oxidoreductase